MNREPNPASPPADRTALRDRIAEALVRWAYCGQDPDPETGILETVRVNAYSRADAVLAVLPEPASSAPTLAAALEGLHTLIATSSRDWGTYRVDAWLWAVLCGWNCEQAEHDETCTHGALEETAAVHGWDAATVAKARRYRAAVRAATAGSADAVLPEPADRAAVLDEAADAIDRETQALRDAEVLERTKFRPCRDASAQLRRMAAEAQQKPTDADVVEAHRLALSFTLGIDADADAEARAADTQDSETPDTLPAWLRRRFSTRTGTWEDIGDSERTYWEHQARAVRRAVARGGFKTAVPQEADRG
ncbi:hypothetical protein [Streptomyces sp. 4F14]|uniref:hypothetical protein n=1 Tax=Streptomyces sp. 4F14 TaxID=3394380 RepID=UPI003A87E9C4